MIRETWGRRFMKSREQAAMPRSTSETARVNPRAILYECGICDCYHPWRFRGDCRDNENRYGSPEEYAKHLHMSVYDVEVLSVDDRVAADDRGER